MKKPLSFLIIILVLGVWWTIAFLLATLQAWGMFKHAWIIPLGVILSALIFWLHYKLYQGTRKNREWANAIVLIYGLVNFIPLFLQLIGLKMPGIDNIVTSIIGLILVCLSKNENYRSSDRQLRSSKFRQK